MARFIFQILICSLVFSSCAVSPLGRKQLILVGSDQMDAMGRSAFAEMKQRTPINRESKNNEYVRCVADSLLSVMENTNPKEWEVVVFEDKTANAFALPGKKIGVHTGILKVAKTPEQLAAVIGHEIGHVIARHGAERVSEALAVQGGLTAAAVAMKEKGPKFQLVMAALGLGAQFGVLLPHSRTQESEADVIGLELMSKAGFDPKESVQLWKNMAAIGGGQPPEFLSTHPSHSTRMEDLNENMPEAETWYLKAREENKKPRCQLKP